MESEKLEKLSIVLRIREKTNDMISELRKRGRMNVVEAALISGYSLSYFRAYILNVLKLLYTNCIDIQRGEIIWKCSE